MLASEGHAHAALRLWAAAERVGRDTGGKLPPSVADERALAVAAATAEVEEAAAAVAWTGGKALDADREF